jgi:hypothetical protein
LTTFFGARTFTFFFGFLLIHSLHPTVSLRSLFASCSYTIITGSTNPNLNFTLLHKEQTNKTTFEMYTPSILVLLASSGLIEARNALDARQFHNVHARNHVDLHARATTAEGATGTTLLANAIQSGSFNDGSDEIGANEANQAKSLTSTNNFINNCAGKTLTNGLQITQGSCNGIRELHTASSLT